MPKRFSGSREGETALAAQGTSVFRRIEQLAFAHDATPAGVGTRRRCRRAFERKEDAAHVRKRDAGVGSSATGCRRTFETRAPWATVHEGRACG
jgi:hypothetical protein